MEVRGSGNAAYKERTQSLSPPEELIRGVEQFNEGNYRQCCNTLEFMSLHEPRNEKKLYQGVIQLALALSACQEADFRAATRLLRMSVQLLQHVTPVCQQVDVSGLITQTELLRQEIESLGMERMHEVSPSFRPHIRLIP